MFFTFLYSLNLTLLNVFPLFLSLINYISIILIYNRSIKRSRMLIDKNEFFAYETSFFINSAKALDEFWSYLVFRLNIESRSTIYERLTRLYNILSNFRYSMDQGVEIRLQETSNYYCFSINSPIEAIIPMIVDRLEEYRFPYRYDQNELRYTIDKRSDAEMTTYEHIAKAPYSFLVPDDLDDISNAIERLLDNANIESPQLSIEEIHAFRTAFSYISSILKFYSELIIVANVIAELSVILSLHHEAILREQATHRVFLYSVMTNLSQWFTTLFIKGGEELDYMNASFQADLDQIKMALNLYDDVYADNASCDLDDIFDF